MEQCLITFPDTLKFVKNIQQNIIFSTLFMVFGKIAKYGLLCLKCLPLKFISNLSSYVQKKRIMTVMVFG